MLCVKRRIVASLANNYTSYSETKSTLVMHSSLPVVRRVSWVAILAAVMLCAQAQVSRKKIVLKVNLGGGPVGDFLGEDQVLDMSEFAKTTSRGAVVQNTDQPDIFQSQRFARGSDFALRLPVPDGVYSVILLFAETFEKACVTGGRVFDISLGTPVSGVSKVEDAFDLFANAGCKTAYGKKFDNVPSKEGIVVHLGQIAQHPTLSGFIVEGFPQPKGDGSEFLAIGHASDAGQMTGAPSGMGLAGENRVGHLERIADTMGSYLG